jgi:hypothetical protein
VPGDPCSGGELTKGGFELGVEGEHRDQEGSGPAADIQNTVVSAEVIAVG